MTTKPMIPTLTPDTMTHDERSCLLYLETVAVDYDGLAEAIRMNQADMEACKKFVELELIEFGRIPMKLLGQFRSGVRNVTHWVTFKPAGWALAHQLRIERAARGLQRPKRQAIEAWRAERAELLA